MDEFAEQTYKPLPFAVRLDSTKVELLEVMFTRSLSSLLQDNIVAEDRLRSPQVRVILLPSSNVCKSITKDEE